MSRRKQAKPRALKRDEVEDFEDDSAEDLASAAAADSTVTAPVPAGPPTLGLNGGLGTPSSWRSSDTPDDQSLSLSPTSCATPSDPDADLTYTIGVTESTPYACQFCDKAFPRLSYLKRHEQIHSDLMPFKCDYCQRLFKHKRSRDRHIKLHTGDKKYRCPHCESAFSRSDHLKIHMKTHDNAKPFQCTVCNRGYNTAAALTSHMQNHRKETPSASSSPLHQQPPPAFRCLQCSAAFPTTRDLQLHVDGHNREGSVSPTEKPTQCAFCPQVCPSPNILRQHVEQSHPLEILQACKCPLCPEVFPSAEALLLHRKVHDDIYMDVSASPEVLSCNPKLGCGFCTKGDFVTLEALQLHVQAMHVPLPVGEAVPPAPPGSRSSPKSSQGFDCEYCTMNFPSVQSLQKHTLAVHSFTDVLSKSVEHGGLFCSQCTMGFGSPAVLADHVRNVHELGGDRTASSSPKPGTTVSTPKEPSGPSGGRKGSHRSKTPVSSGRPPKSAETVFNGTPHFPPPSTLLCSQCNAAFPDFESFRTHLKSHLDAVMQRFTCSECEGEFGTEEQLDTHVASHFLATSMEYGCQCCSKLFPKPDELQKHLMDIHAHHLYRCALCKEMFDSKVGIQVHFAVKHSNECRLFRCTSCSAVYRSEVEFQLHVKVAHLCKVAQSFRCLLCDQCFMSELQLQCHLDGHKKQFVCALCDEAFHVEFLLDRHLQTNHATQDSSLRKEDSSSPVAPPEVAQNLSLKSRVRGGGGTPATSGGETTTSAAPTTSTAALPSSSGKDIRCEICDATFPSEASLAAHRRQAHNIRTAGTQKAGQTTLSLFCAYCNESCKSRTELENHMKAHTASPSKHKCNICDEICPSAATLAEHKLTHCKVVAGSLCVACKVGLQSEEQFYSHVQQHNSHGLPLPCVVCRQTLMSDVEVQLHARFHLKNAEPPLHPCCVCARRLEAANLIITGKQDGAHTYMCKDCFHAKSKGLLRCQDCQVKFESGADLEKHRLVAHKKTYQCIKCQMSFESEAEIQIHVASHVMQEGMHHECRLCHKVLDSPAKLQCHLIEHTFEGCASYTCYMCSAVFTSPHLIQQHMLEHGLHSRPYDCPNCHQRFFFRAELENHAFVHEVLGGLTGEEVGLQCPDCSKVFHSAVNLGNHRKIHEQKNSTLKCSLCPEVFQASADMQQHHFRQHGDADLQDAKKCFPCTECEKVFPCMSNLQGHMRIHTQGTKYTCPECRKEFALSRNLNIHMRSHSGEKPYECPVCKKCFARKENRKAHLKSHAGLKPFMCPHCGKTFSRKCHVKEHMRIHASPHPCPDCADTFSSARQLRRHLSDAHHKHFDHVCTVCGDVFDHARGLDHHLARAHRVTTDTASLDDPSESSPEHSSTSKDMDSSECSSLTEEVDEGCRDSPVTLTTPATPTAADDNTVPPPEVAA